MCGQQTLVGMMIDVQTHSVLILHSQEEEGAVSVSPFGRACGVRMVRANEGLAPLALRAYVHTVLRKKVLKIKGGILIYLGKYLVGPPQI